MLRSAGIDVTPTTMCAVIIGALNATGVQGLKKFRLVNTTTSSFIADVHNTIFSVCDIVLSRAYDVGRYAWDLQVYCGLPIRTGQELRAIFSSDRRGRDACNRALPVSSLLGSKKKGKSTM